MALYKQWEKLQQTSETAVTKVENVVPFGEVDINVNSSSSGQDQGSTADFDPTSDEVIVLDGAKLKSLIKDYARECIREELANVLKMLS